MSGKIKSLTIVALLLSSPTLAATLAGTDNDPTGEWADVLVSESDAAANVDTSIVQPRPYYRWLCQAKSRSRSKVFSHSANNIGQAQYRSLGKCRSEMDASGYYPGYCQLVSCEDRW